MFRFNRAIRTFVIPSTITAALANFHAHCEKDDQKEVALTTALRLKPLMDFDKLEPVLMITGGLKFFIPKKGTVKYDKDKVVIAQVVQADINCSSEEIENIWLDQHKRNDWDSTISGVFPVKETKGSAISYFAQDKKDYVSEIFKISGNIITLHFSLMQLNRKFV